MRAEICINPASAAKDAQVAGTLKQMAAVLKNLKTYDLNSPVLKRSLDTLSADLLALLKDNESITLLVGDSTLTYGNTVVYSCTDKLESLAFALYKDGIRLITLRSDISQKEIFDFVSAVHEAREADPYQSDLVTILWEKDLAHIHYRAVDAYLEDREKQEIEQLAQKCDKECVEKVSGEIVLGPEFFVKELGLSPREHQGEERPQTKAVTAADARDIIQELLQEDEPFLLKRCSEICLEVAYDADEDNLFHGVVSFLGRICAWLASSGDFLSACSIVSDLRALAGRQDLPTARRDSITDTIARLGDRRTITEIAEHLDDFTDSREEEVFAYLVLMAPCAVEPLCELLANSEKRDIRHLLCRAISIIARNHPDGLRHLIADKRWYVLRNAATIMGMMGNPEVVPLLRLAASHEEPRVRKEVARSLGRVRSDEGLGVLKDLIRDESSAVRLAAVLAIRDIGTYRAVNILEETIKDKAFRRRAIDEKKETMITYGTLGEKSFGLLKAMILGDVDGIDDRTCAAAAYGLAMIDDAQAVSLLRALAETGDGPVKFAACEALSLLDRKNDLRDTVNDPTGPDGH